MMTYAIKKNNQRREIGSAKVGLTALRKIRRLD